MSEKLTVQLSPELEVSELRVGMSVVLAMLARPGLELKPGMQSVPATVAPAFVHAIGQTSIEFRLEYAKVIFTARLDHDGKIFNCDGTRVMVHRIVR